VAEPTNPDPVAGRWLRTSEDPKVNIPYELHLLRRRFPTVILWFGQATRHFWALVDDRLIEAESPQELANAITDARVWPPREVRSGHRQVWEAPSPGAAGPYGPKTAEATRPAVMSYPRRTTTFVASPEMRRRRRELGSTRSPLNKKPLRRRIGSWLPPRTATATW
jgi:hypothetical protein